jgi:hypothetical protein
MLKAKMLALPSLAERDGQGRRETCRMMKAWKVDPMDELTIKTPNPKCRLFFKIDLLTDFGANV